MCVCGGGGGGERREWTDQSASGEHDIMFLLPTTRHPSTLCDGLLLLTSVTG